HFSIKTGPKDLPRIARTAGRLAGRAIGYVQLARGQFENVMQQSQATQVHKELQDTMAQLEAIRYEIRGISIMNPGPLTRRLVDNPNIGNNVAPKVDEEQIPPQTIFKENGSIPSNAANLESQATAFARLAEAQALKNDSLNDCEDLAKSDGETDLFTVLPVSAESANLLPKLKVSICYKISWLYVMIDDAKGSDIMLEAVLEAEVAQNAKQFFENLLN
ncbi:hypothetical protein IFM89_007778, partial [Coptis chinensis]